ncbi:MAG: hypothetical protein U9Q15_00540 [Patescibacteria group bacterium]|nr:hypothetical protein [Patescibacteria group bacterium]
MKLAPFPFETIIEWQQENGRHSLPWRQFFDVQKHEIAYHIWVSEIMLQQTQVSRVVDYYNRFIEKYPTI